MAYAEFADRTYSDLLRDLEARKALANDPARVTTQIKRIKWLLRKAGWVPQTRVVCRADVLEFFARIKPAEVSLTAGSLATYKSDVLGAFDAIGGRSRQRNVTDITGIWSDLHKEIRESDLVDDLKRAAGAFLVYLTDADIKPGDVTQAVLANYFEHRLATGKKDEVACKKHVKRVACLFTALSQDQRFARFACRPVAHPFPDGRDKFGVPNAEIADLLQEWDRDVVPWAMGLASRDGKTREALIAELDELAEEETDDQQRRRERRARRKNRRKKDQESPSKRRDEILRRHGFLTVKDRWAEKTARTRRGYIVALAKAHFAATGERIGTIEELTDPEVLEDAADSLSDANANGEFDSTYVASVIKTVRKIAVGFVGRDETDAEDIKDLIEEHSCVRRGIAPRNKARLAQFTPERIQKMLDLTDTLVNEVNRTVEKRRKAHRREHGTLPKPASCYDVELACDVMAALAHAIMLKRGPRSANLVAIRLEWIRWQEDLATIVIPASEVKLRRKGDPDLPIPLGKSVSRLLRAYLDNIREKALLPGDEKNAYLFPGQDRRRFTTGRPYKGILQRLMVRVHATVGVRINPHLYRHLIGWIWLRDDLDNLPKVQKLLGHKSLQTTIDYYAEIDEELALDKWQERIDRKAS